MKKFIQILSVLFSILLTSGCNYKNSSAMIPETKIIVATDLHYLTDELNDHSGYFQQIIQSGDGKVMDYSEELIDAFIDQVSIESPDVLILSGDLSFNGEKLSLLSLANKLETLIDQGIRVAVIPGNHDIDYTTAAHFHDDTYTLVENVSADDFKEIYQDLGYSQAIALDDSSCSYVFPINEQLRLLMVDVNGNGNPGVLTKETLTWVETQLKQAKQDQVKIIAVSHQTVLTHNPIFVDGYQIYNVDELINLYEKYDVLCNLAGHMHIQDVVQTDDGLTEILTSALSITPLQYGVLDIADQNISYQSKQLAVDTWQPRTSQDEIYRDLSEYAYQFFWDNTYRQAYSSVSSHTNAEELATFMADLNIAYFSGTLDQLQWDEELVNTWKESGTFWAIYLLSIEQSGIENETYWTSEF